jgi:hypothetical protein
MHHDHLLSQLLGIPLSQFPDGGEIFPNSRTYDELNLRSSTIQQLRSEYLQSRQRESELPGKENHERVVLSSENRHANQKACLIITSDRDVHADVVVELLRRNEQAVFRWHPFSPAHRMEVSSNDGARLIDGVGRAVTADGIGKVWWRAPRLPAKSRRGTDEIDIKERTAFVASLPSILKCAWHSDPRDVDQANQKLTQLTIASSLGFNLPEYLISSDPNAIESFLKKRQSVVLKPLNEASKAITDENGTRVHLVKRFEAAHLAEALRDRIHGPIFIQTYVEKDFDVRVTKVGGATFAHRIVTGSTTAPVDWRLDGYQHKELRFVPIQLPENIESRINTYLARLNIDVGCFDFSVAPDGEWYFLECNPTGQWLWAEFETQQPISEAFMNLLISGPICKKKKH